jgi:hypothetical protein
MHSAECDAMHRNSVYYTPRPGTQGGLRYLALINIFKLYIIFKKNITIPSSYLYQTMCSKKKKD